MDGNVVAIRELIDRTEGKAPQNINVGGQKDNQLPSEEVDARLVAILDTIEKSEKEDEE